TKQKPKPKPAPKPKPKAKGRAPVKDDRRRTTQVADRSVRHAGHHGGRQREEGRRARSLEGQRHG
ncbi:MAG TPA: putative lipid II flippase FtsW, partial [Mycobacterium sp.]